MDKQKLLRAAKSLQGQFGSEWTTIVQTLGTENLRRRAGKDLTSFIAFPEREKGGSATWRGNCSPQTVAAILQYVMDAKRYYRRDLSGFTLLDPMSGSGTSLAAADSLGVKSVLYDLNPNPAHGIGGWNALKDDVEHDADCIFFHPPYHSIIQYSGRMWGDEPHPDDLSQCESYEEFLDKLNYVIKKLYMALRKDGRMAILVGDVRKNGRFYSIQNDIMTLGQMEGFIVKGQYNCASDNRRYSTPFIPIVTEYIILLKKEGGLVIPFTRRVSGTFNMLQFDNSAVTWNHLVRNVLESKGGKATAEEIYALLENHPKAQGRRHFRERIRAVIQEYPDLYRHVGRGVYQLAYPVAA